MKPITAPKTALATAVVRRIETAPEDVDFGDITGASAGDSIAINGHESTMPSIVLHVSSKSLSEVGSEMMHSGTSSKYTPERLKLVSKSS